MMVLPDRFMLTETGALDNRPVPVAMAGAWIRAAVTRKMNESDAEQSDMHIDPGCELLEYFLRGGLARVR
jgi:2,3-bisphosphoglycerate-independent phosphoglycerate mutase